MNEWDKLEKNQIRREKQMEKELISNYKQSLKELRLVMLELDAEISLGGGGEDQLFSKMQQYNRMNILMQKIDRELQRLTGESYDGIFSGLSDVYTETFNETVETSSNLLGASQSFQRSVVLDQPTLNLAVSNTLAGLSIGELSEREFNELRFGIRQELTQGFIQNEGYKQLSDRLANRLNVSATRAMRIVRTESNRIHNQAAHDSMRALQDQGVKMKKKWVSGNDKRTRSSHSRLNGKIIETDDYFRIGQYEAQSPGQFGVAKLDVNCRCRLIPVFDDEQDIEIENEQQFEQTIAAQEEEKIEEKAENKPRFKPFTTIAEAESYLKDTLNFKKLKVADLSIEAANVYTEKLTDLLERYPIQQTLKEFRDDTKGVWATGAYDMNTGSLGISVMHHGMFKEEEHWQAYFEKSKGFAVGTRKDSIITHEFGHAIDGYISKNGGADWKLGKSSYKIILFSDKVTDELFKELKIKKKDQFDYVKSQLGTYATTNNQEIFAEAFNDYIENGDKASDLSKKIMKKVDKAFKEAKKYEQSGQPFVF